MRTLTGAVMAVAFGSVFAAAPSPGPQRQNELVHLVRQDCGSCHGIRFRGGLGPALVPEALKDKPADSLVSTILHGRPGTAMPPWNKILSGSKADWIVDRLQKDFPDAR